jgi:hypothetical protein
VVEVQGKEEAFPLIVIFSCSTQARQMGILFLSVFARVFPRCDVVSWDRTRVEQRWCRLACSQGRCSISSLDGHWSQVLGNFRTTDLFR